VVGLSVCLSVCLLVTFVSPAKTAEPIDMPFGGLSQVGPTTMYRSGTCRFQGEGAISGGCLPHCKALKAFAAEDHLLVFVTMQNLSLCKFWLNFVQ